MMYISVAGEMTFCNKAASLPMTAVLAVVMASKEVLYKYYFTDKTMLDVLLFRWKQPIEVDWLYHVSEMANNEIRIEKMYCTSTCILHVSVSKIKHYQRIKVSMPKNKREMASRRHGTIKRSAMILQRVKIEKAFKLTSHTINQWHHRVQFYNWPLLPSRAVKAAKGGSSCRHRHAKYYRHQFW